MSGPPAESYSARFFFIDFHKGNSHMNSSGGRDVWGGKRCGEEGLIQI